MSKTFFLILNYNNAPQTIATVQSLEREGSVARGQIWLIDNGSTDHSVIAFQKKFPDLQILQTKQNLGYAGGHNFGVRKALALKADVTVLLNNDLLFAPGSLAQLLIFLKNNPKVGVAGPTVFYPQRGYDYGGRLQRWWGRTTHLLKKELWLGARFVDYASGCCLAVRAQVWQQVGLLPEEYFLYWEDADFCLTVRRAGWSVALCATPPVTHLESQTIGKTSLRQIYYYWRGSFIFHFKYLSGFRRQLALLWLLPQALWFWLHAPNCLRTLWQAWRSAREQIAKIKASRKN